MLRPDQILYTYLHLAPDYEQTVGLVGSGAVCIAYETVELPNGTLPLLAPMSEVAGRMATIVGRAVPAEDPWRSRRAHGRRPRRASRERCRPRRRRRRHERDVHGGRHGCRHHRSRREHGPDPLHRRPLGEPRPHALQQSAQHRGGSVRRRSRHRCGATSGCAHPVARHQGHAPEHEEGLGRCGRLGRPGRLHRDVRSRPLTPTRRTSSRVCCTTAWQTCPARSRTPRRML